MNDARGESLNDGGYGGHYGGYRDDDSYRLDTSPGWERMKAALREAWMSLKGEGDRGRRTFAGKGPKGYRRSDDRIREDVCDRLTRHPRVDASELEITVRDGEVTLSGTVDERSMKRIAERIVDDVAGVRDVINQVRVMREASRPVSGT